MLLENKVAAFSEIGSRFVEEKRKTRTWKSLQNRSTFYWKRLLPSRLCSRVDSFIRKAETLSRTWRRINNTCWTKWPKMVKAGLWVDNPAKISPWTASNKCIYPRNAFGKILIHVTMSKTRLHLSHLTESSLMMAAQFTAMNFIYSPPQIHTFTLLAEPFSCLFDFAFSRKALHESSKIFIEYVLHVARIQSRIQA